MSSKMIAAAILAAGVISSSCSKGFDIADKDLIKNGVSTDANGGFISLPVTAESAWTADFAEEEDWIMLLCSAGDGAGSVELFVDENFTQIARDANVIIKCDGREVSVKVGQSATVDGIIPSNDEEMPFYKVAKTKGLGAGYDVVNDKRKLNSVFSVTPLVELIGIGYGYDEIYHYEKIEITEGQQDIRDSLVNKLDTLKVSAQVQLSFSKFKFDAKGEYNSGQKTMADSTSYITARQFPLAKTYVSYTELLEKYAEYEAFANEYPEQASKLTREDEFFYVKALLSTGFAKQRRLLSQALAAGESYESETVQKILANIIKSYGASVVVGSTLGGNCSLLFDTHGTNVEEKMGIAGEVAAKLNIGLFNLELGVTVEYAKIGTEVLGNSYYECAIYGGNKEARDKVLSVLDQCADRSNIGKPDEEIVSVYKQLPMAISEWSKTIALDEVESKNKSEVISWEIVPISIFLSSEDESQKYMEDYIKDIYKDDYDILIF